MQGDSQAVPRLTARAITRGIPEIAEIRSLYARSFPREEQVPIEGLIEGNRAKDFVAVYEDGKFCGFYALLNNLGISHITFFAVEESMRGRGIGSRILRLIAGSKPGNRVIADLERPGEGEPNNEERLRRIGFYKRNGFRETEIRYTWRGVNYQILALGGDVSEEEFEAFWRDLDRNRLV